MRFYGPEKPLFDKSWYSATIWVRSSPRISIPGGRVANVVEIAEQRAPGM